MTNWFGCAVKEHKALLMEWGTHWHIVAQIIMSCSCSSTLLSAAISSTCSEDLIHSWIVPWISPHHLLYLVNYSWYLSSWPVMNLQTYSVCEATRAGQSISFTHQPTAPSMYIWLAPWLLLQNFTSQNPTNDAHKHGFSDSWTREKMQITRPWSLILSPVYSISFLYNTTDA